MENVSFLLSLSFSETAFFRKSCDFYVCGSFPGSYSLIPHDPGPYAEEKLSEALWLVGLDQSPHRKHLPKRGMMSGSQS